jgi:hypothetical protein
MYAVESIRTWAWEILLGSLGMRINKYASHSQIAGGLEPNPSRDELRSLFRFGTYE